MKRPPKTRRNAVALSISTGFHVALLALILSQAAPVYETPESFAPPLDVEIVTLPETPPQPIVVPHIPPPKPEERTRPERAPSLPAPTPPPTPPTPTAPAVPAPSPPKPAPPQPPVVSPLPTPAPAPKPLPVLPTPTKPTPTPPAASTAPPLPAPQALPQSPAPAPPLHMVIHKPEKDAPATVPTLPFAPSPSRPAGGPSMPSPGGEPNLGGSRLTGLTPYPYGAMPSGGSGLRGTLVGCANADAVSLSAVERARCNERFGAAAGSAPAFDPISPAKRAGFDKAAAAQEADRRYRSGMPTGTSSGKPGFGSGLGDDQPTSLRDRLTPHP